MKTDVVALQDLGGGINQGDAPGSLANNQCSDIVNWDAIETHLSRRGGMARVLTNPIALPAQCLATPIHGIHFFESGVMLFGLYDRFSRRDGTGVVDISTGAEVVALSVMPWSMVDNKGVVWAARENGSLWRLTEFLASIAGVTAPTIAPTLANGGAGLIGVGVYQYFVSFYTALGDESDASPIAEITLAGASDVDITAIQNSSQAHVIGKRIWRSLPNDAGQLWLVASIGPAVTTYTDNTPNDELGVPFEYDNGQPPAAVYSLTKWRERLWCHDKVQVYASKVGKFETFSETFDSFDARGDREVRAIHAWDKDRLIVGTTVKLFVVTQTGFDESGARFNVDDFSLSHGCVSHHSMQSAEGMLFWLDVDGVYASSGGAPVCVSTPRVRAILKAIDSGEFEAAVAYIDAGRTQYRLSIGNVQLAYNWRTGAWTTARYSDDSASEDGATATAAPSSVAVRDGVTYCGFGLYNAYEMNSGNVDRGRNAWRITARARLKGIRAVGFRTALRKVYADITRHYNPITVPPLPAPVLSSEEITMRVFQDGRPNKARENTVTIDATPVRSVKRIGLGVVQDGAMPLCDEFEVEFEYSGEAGIDINEVAFERDLFKIAGRSQ